MPVVVSIRALLFWPFLLATVLPKRAGSLLPAQKAQESNQNVFIVMGVGATYLFCIQTMLTLSYNGFSFRGIVGAVNNDPAVSALGYDYLLSLVSAGLWYRISYSGTDDKTSSAKPEKKLLV